MDKHPSPFPARPSVAERVKQAARESAAARFEGRATRLCRRLLVRFNNRDTDLASTRLTDLVAEMVDRVEGVIPQMFGGMVTSDTPVTGFADVDALILISGYDTAMRPGYVREDFAKVLVRRLKGQCQVADTGLAITVSWPDDLHLQLLPAITLPNGSLKMASSRSATTWSAADPVHFQGAFAKADLVCGGGMVPMLKLAKLINHSLPDQHQLSGYLLEGLATACFGHYRGATTTTGMLRHFYATAPDLVLTPLVYPNGGVMHVDDHLGAAASAERATTAKTLRRVRRALHAAMAQRSIKNLQLLFEQH